MTDTHPFEEEQSLEPTWGLGAMVDPVRFGAALVDLAGRVASDPSRLASAAANLAVGLVETSAAVTARALGQETAGPVAVDVRDARLGKT